MLSGEKEPVGGGKRKRRGTKNSKSVYLQKLAETPSLGSRSESSAERQTRLWLGGRRGAGFSREEQLLEVLEL